MRPRVVIITETVMDNKSLRVRSCSDHASQSSMNSFLNFCVMNLVRRIARQAHPQAELVSAIASDASHAVGTDSIDKAIERKRVQLVSEVRKLGSIPLMSVVEQ